MSNIEDFNIDLAEAKNLIKENRFLDALKIYNKIISHIDNNPKLFFDRGFIYVSLKDIESSRKDWLKAIDLAPDFNPNIYLNLVQTYINEDEHKDLERALEILDAGLDNFTNNIVLVHTKLNILLGSNNSQDSLEILDKYIKIMPNDLTLREKRFSLFLSLKKIKEAKIDAEFLMSLDGSKPSNMDKYGLICFLEDRYQEASDIFEKIVQKGFLNSIVLIRLGLSYVGQNRHETAIEIFSRIIENDANFYPAYFYRAVCYDWLKKDELALEDYNKALSINNKSPEAYANRGRILYRMGNKKEADADLEFYASLIY